MSRLLGHDVLEAEFPLGVGSALGKNVLEPWLRQIGFHPERGGPLAEADCCAGDGFARGIEYLAHCGQVYGRGRRRRTFCRGTVS